MNAPYVLPRAAHAAILGGDVQAARSAIEKLNAFGTRGRAVDADRATVKAGIAAIEGDPSAALPGIERPSPRGAISVCRSTKRSRC